MRGFNVLHCHRLGRVRPAGRAVRGQDRRASGDHHAREHRQLPPADEARRALARLGRARSTPPIPTYYRWTQWIFLKLFERGLAYVAEVPVNWCPELGTVLANEEVIDGRSEVGGFEVVRRPMRQWVLKITAYADRLLDDLTLVDWPASTLEMQRNWIGRSIGAEVEFALDGVSGALRIFTTRPDTLFGATYMVLAPEHPLVDARDARPSSARRSRPTARPRARKSDLAAPGATKEKTGVFTGGHAINPVNGEQLPIWIADYVLMGYGTGAIMAVPAHDERDWEFARTFGLPIREVVTGGDVDAGARTSIYEHGAA